MRLPCRSPVSRGDPTREDRLIRKHLGRVAVVILVVGMTVAAPMAVEGAATAASAGVITCGFLDDGGGSGSASSLPPGATPHVRNAVLTAEQPVRGGCATTL
jgi:hypothetical protein